MYSSLEKFTVSSVNKQIQLGISSIEASGQLLGEAEITADKSILETAIDRKVYNVEKDLMSKAGSASDILGNVPSVSVSIDGVVSLRGSSNLTILINGKPSPMMKFNSAAALQSIPANTIERIEIITNPSAKYRPDGAAGIINIILKKETRTGLNGVITANATLEDRYNANLTMNYKPKKVNYYGSYSVRKDNRPRTSSDLRTIIDSAGANSYFNQTRISESRPLSHTADIGADYTINNKNEIGISGNLFLLDFVRTDNLTTVIKDSAIDITDNYDRNRYDKEFEWEKEVGISYEHKFKKEDHTLQVELNLADHFEQENNKFTNIYRTPLLTSTFDNTRISQREKQNDIIAEYTYPINEDAELEAGYSWQLLKQDFDFFGEYYDNSQWFKDLKKSNKFLFTQQVHALYATYSQEIEDFSCMAGLRVEQANITSNLVTFDSVVTNNYFKLYPSIHIAYQLNDQQKLQLSYTKRVNRPEGDELNPFPEYADPKNLFAGNPKVKPEQLHSIELGYQFKNDKITFVPSIYYRYKYDAFTEITKYINDSTRLTTFDNIANEQSSGLEVILTRQVKKILSINLSGNIFYNQLNAANLGYATNRTNITGFVKLGATVNMSKNTTMQLNANYNSPELTPQGRYLGRFVLNTGLRQEFFKKKAALLITASDLLNTLKWRSEMDTPELKGTYTSKRKSQIIYVGFSCRFGGSDKKTEDLKFDNKIEK